jgi:transposase InsO family protein
MYPALESGHDEAWEGPAAKANLARYLHFYNSRRPHSSLDAWPPDAAYFNSPDGHFKFPHFWPPKFPHLSAGLEHCQAEAGRRARRAAASLSR